MSGRRNGLRRQVTEATEGPLELGREREAGKSCLGKRVGGNVCGLQRDPGWALHPKVF